jgi:citrate lyase beta subunit
MYVPPRALLFVPAHRDRFREKALGIAVDALILDLEDAVPPAEKPVARDKAVAFRAPEGRERR